MNKSLLTIGTLAAVAILSVIQTTEAKVKSLENGQTGRVYYESYLKSDLTLTGWVKLPEGATSKVPAVILVHGSGAIGYREATWGKFFRDNGYATMVIDMFGPRGFKAMSGPNVGSYQDVFDAFNILKTHPKIDPDRISVMGWSLGGGFALSSASLTEERGNGHTLRAIVSFYPVCSLNAIPSTGNEDAKILLVIGTKDTYSKDWQCKQIVDKGVRDGRKAELIVYEGAYHGFDGNKNLTYMHGKFGKQTIQANKGITERARRDVLNFLKASMKVDANNSSKAKKKPAGCSDPNFAKMLGDMCK